MAKNKARNGHAQSDQALTETQRSNVKIREERIKEARRAVYAKQKEIKELLESSGINALRQDVSEIKSKLAEDFGIVTKVFNAGMGLYKLQREAQENGDEIMQDVVAEIYSTLEIGETVDLAQATGADEQEISDTLTDAKKKGTAAGKEGASFDTNPYPEGSKHHAYWAQNWQAAQTKLAGEIGQTAAAH